MNHYPNIASLTLETGVMFLGVNQGEKDLNNWARSGATTQTLISQGQYTGLTSQIEPNSIKLVIVQVDANDFAPYKTNCLHGLTYNNAIYEGVLASSI